MALSAHVDAMITVARLNMLRRPSLAELARALETCPTIQLGVVVTGAETEPGYGYGYGYVRRRVPPRSGGEVPGRHSAGDRRRRRRVSAVSPARASASAGPVLDSDATRERRADRPRPSVAAASAPHAARRRDRGRSVRRYLLVADLTALAVAFAALQFIFPAQAIGRPACARQRASALRRQPASVGRAGPSDRALRP